MKIRPLGDKVIVAESYEMGIVVAEDRYLVCVRLLKDMPGVTIPRNPDEFKYMDLDNFLHDDTNSKNYGPDKLVNVTKTA